MLHVLKRGLVLLPILCAMVGGGTTDTKPLQEGCSSFYYPPPRRMQVLEGVRDPHLDEDDVFLHFVGPPTLP